MGNRPELAAAAVVFVLGLLMCIIGGAPTTYLLDSSELVATTRALGISHPPGHPAFHAFAGAFGALPLGNWAVRVHAFSVLRAAAAAALVPIAAARLGWVRGASEATVFGALGVATAGAHAFVFQGIRAEVYSLNVLLVAAALTLLLRTRRDLAARDVALTAVLLGIGLLNHHYLTLFAFPAVLLAVVLWSPGVKALGRNIIVGCGFGATLLAGYAWLVARGAARPAASWVWPVDGERLWWLVSAQAFQKSAAEAASVDLGLTASNLVGLLGEQFTVAGLVCAGTALGLLAVRRTRSVAVLVVALLANLATQGIMGFDPNNPDVGGYFMLSVWLIGLLAGFVFAVPLEEKHRLRALSWAMPTAACAFAAWALVAPRGADVRYDLRDNWDSEVMRDVAFMPPSPGGLWVTSYFETGFNTWYAQAIEDRRPDVTHLHRAWLTYPYYREMLEARAPQTTGLFGDDTERGGLDDAGLRAWAASATVHLEADAVLTGAEARWCPVDGAWLRCGAATPQVARTTARWRGLFSMLSDPLEIQTRRNIVWTLYNLASVRCSVGAIEECTALAGLAAELAPEDQSVAALLERATGAP